jgi:hypothetical protein
MSTYLISEDYLKSLTPISSNIDVTMLTPHIESSQIIWQREILGRVLYDDIIAKFAAQTLSADEIELVSYMKPAIAFRTVFEALPFLSIQIKPKGAVKLRGEFEDQASLGEVKYLRDNFEKKSQYYEERVVEYLCLNGQKFPLYGKSDLATGVNPINTDAFDSDIYLGDAEAQIRINRRYFNF